MAIATVEQGVAALSRGEMIIVIDDEDRENEGDILIAGEAVTPEAIAFMMKNARGLICVSLPGERLDALELPLMVSRNSESMKTAFTVSVDLIGGTTTGISAADRSATVRALVDPATRPDHLARPGHIFPLRGHPDGVLGRAGHTEAALDLTQLAGFSPCGVICEIAREDGSMARLPDLEIFADQHGLLIVTIADLIEYRRRETPRVLRISEARLPTRYGEFRAFTYRETATGHEHIALVKGNVADKGAALPIRLHSECVTGEALGSLRCDCGEQLDQALSIIVREGRGCLVYLRGHEGRGIGLANKIASYRLQDQGLDTFAANRQLGFADDERSYAAACDILADLGISSIELLTDNPEKVAAVKNDGRFDVRRRGLFVATNESNVTYMTAKRQRAAALNKAV